MDGSQSMLADAVPRPRLAQPRSKPRSVTVLGATGSIGLNTLDLIARNAGDYEVVALTANRNASQLAQLAIAHRAKFAVVADATQYAALKSHLAGTGIRAAAGEAALVEAAQQPADWVMAAIVGAAGLHPTFAAAKRKTTVALANKECLVSAGAVFLKAIAASGSTLLPVDSEHCGVFQAIDPGARDTIERIVVTASGGPFRTWPKEKIATATVADALKHPNWSMGAKITIDSATMMNKGLEIIEAHHLFGLSAERLGVVVHPQSIVHALVEYIDGSVLAQLSCPDMRTPIAHSLAWPTRMQSPTPRLDLAKIGQLTFEEPDDDRFPALPLARAALARGGNACTILNAANEIAVEAFLAGRLSFYGVVALVRDCLDKAEASGMVVACHSLADVLDADAYARGLARALLLETQYQGR